MATQLELEPRMIRGYAIIAKGEEIKRVDASTFIVPSQSGNGSYQVTISENSYSCSCPDYVYRHGKVGICKHGFAVKFYLRIRGRLEEEAPSDQEASQCKWCGSLFIMKYGHDAGKQVWKCKDCNRKFVLDEGFKRLRKDPNVVCSALDLYFKGVSLRKITDHLQQIYGIEVDFRTIHRWMKKYVQVLSEYVNSLTPQLSGKWNVDEMMVKCRGGFKLNGDKAEWLWLWNVMDRETRYLLASQLTAKREIEDARRLFQLAKERAKSKPSEIVTDGLQAYKDAVRKEFYTLKNPRTKHISHIRLAGDMNNNILERLNGTKRERDKVLRGMKSEDTPIREGFDIYYNFVRPHQALHGLTPAEVAEIGVDGQNRWMELLKKALRTYRV